MDCMYVIIDSIVIIIFFLPSGLHDQYESRDFICKQFLKLNGNRKRGIYHHYTNATDKRNVEFVFDASMDVIMKGNLQTIGMM